MLVQYRPDEVLLIFLNISILFFANDIAHFKQFFTTHV